MSTYSTPQFIADANANDQAALNSATETNREMLDKKEQAAWDLLFRMEQQSALAEIKFKYKLIDQANQMG